MKPAQIAQKIGKHRSVVTREVARSGFALKDYTPQITQKQARQRKKANATKATPAIYETIAEGIANEWSPEQIKGRCHKQGQAMLSRAAIYHYIWRDQRQGGYLYKGLRRANRPYRKRYGKPDGLKRPRNPVSIIDRQSWLKRRALVNGNLTR